ncbi:hypothetical protein ACIO8H_35085 [Streptomyces sp. NPDC087226]|uniref:hypothetical protein n=1 Tax=Streptomyces sp. NPDC087226 TaxID=3365771 RepID=UPI003807646E
MAASSMSSVCFQVPGEIARSVKRLPDEVQRLAALAQYFEQSVRPGEARTSENGQVVRSSSLNSQPDAASAELFAADRLVREMGHDPGELSTRLTRLVATEAERRASADPAREPRHDVDEPGRRFDHPTVGETSQPPTGTRPALDRRPDDAAQGPFPVVHTALTQDARAQEFDRELPRKRLGLLLPADPLDARSQTALASYDSPASPDGVRTSETGVRTLDRPGDSAAPPRSAEPAALRTLLAGLNNFGAYRVDADPSWTQWKESQPTESGINPFGKSSGGLRKFFTRKPDAPVIDHHNVGSPMPPVALDSPRDVPVDSLSDRDVEKILTHPIATRDHRIIGVSLHDDNDWSRRESIWSGYDLGQQAYASYPYAQLAAQIRPLPWAGHGAFYVTMHGEFDKAKAYLNSGKKKIVDSFGLARIIETRSDFRRLRRENPDLQVVLVICESGLTRERSMAQQLANLLGVTVHAPNGKIALAPSQTLGSTGLTVYSQGTEAGTFLTFFPGNHSIPQDARPGTRDTTAGRSANSASWPLNQASRLRGGAPDLVSEWHQTSSTGAFIRSPKLKRIDTAVSELSEDRGNPSLLHAVLSAVTDWQKEKNPTSDRWEAVQRLELQIRTELDTADETDVRALDRPRASAAPPRPVEPAALRTLLAGLNNFGAYRVDADPSWTQWKESQPTESGINPFGKSSGGLRKFFTRKPDAPVIDHHNVGLPTQPAALDLPKGIRVSQLGDRDVAKILTRSVTIQDRRIIGMSFHHDEDWSRREDIWASYSPRQQVYASYPYMELIASRETLPWVGHETFYITAHGQYDVVKLYQRSGNSIKEKIVDSSGLARIVEVNPDFQRLRRENPDLQVVLVICESGLTRERSMAQQLANLLGVTVHAPNGEVTLMSSQTLGSTALTVYSQGEEAGTFLTFFPGNHSIPQDARPGTRDTTAGRSANSASWPLNQASRLRGGAPDLVSEWHRASSTGAFVRSAKLKRIDTAVSELSEDRGNPSRLRAVLSAVTDWQKEKNPTSDRWEAVQRLELQVRTELDTADEADRLTREPARSQRPPERRAEEPDLALPGHRVAAARNPVTGRVLAGSGSADALMRRVLQERLSELAPGSADHVRVQEVLSTYSSSHVRPVAKAPRSEAPGRWQAGGGTRPTAPEERSPGSDEEVPLVVTPPEPAGEGVFGPHGPVRSPEPPGISGAPSVAVRPPDPEDGTLGSAERAGTRPDPGVLHAGAAVRMSPPLRAAGNEVGTSLSVSSVREPAGRPPGREETTTHAAATGPTAPSTHPPVRVPAQDVARALAAFAEDVRPALRVWDRPVADEVAGLENDVLRTWGSRSVVFGAHPVSPATVINVGGTLRWFAHGSLEPVPAPASADGPVVSLDLDDNGQLTGPRARSAADSGARTGFCAVNVGADLSQVLGWRAPDAPPAGPNGRGRPDDSREAHAREDGPRAFLDAPRSSAGD